MSQETTFIKLKDQIIQLQAIEGIVPITEDGRYGIKVNMRNKTGYYLIEYETEAERDNRFEHIWTTFIRCGIYLTVE